MTLDQSVGVAPTHALVADVSEAFSLFFLLNALLQETVRGRTGSSEK